MKKKFDWNKKFPRLKAKELQKLYADIKNAGAVFEHSDKMIPLKRKTMKTKLLSVICLLSSVISPLSSATLVDMTPGGFDLNTLTQGSPYYRFWIQMIDRSTFLDEAAHGYFDLPEGRTFLDGWVSRYGLLNGADFFSTDLFGHDTPLASISWNMANAPDGYWLSMIHVWGRDANGMAWDNIYGVPWNDRFLSFGEVSVHEGVNIQSIAFYGINMVPDTGSTLLLFVIAWAALAPACALMFGHFWRKAK